MEVWKVRGDTIVVEKEFAKISSEFVLISPPGDSASPGSSKSADVGVRFELSTLPPGKCIKVEFGPHPLAESTLDLSISAGDQICFNFA